MKYTYISHSSSSVPRSKEVHDIHNALLFCPSDWVVWFWFNNTFESDILDFVNSGMNSDAVWFFFSFEKGRVRSSQMSTRQGFLFCFLPLRQFREWGTANHTAKIMPLHYTSCLLLVGRWGLAAVKALVMRAFPVCATGIVVKLLKCMNLKFW